MRTVVVCIERSEDATPTALVCFPDNLQGNVSVPVYHAIQAACTWAIENLGLADTQIDEFSGGYIVFAESGEPMYLRCESV